MVAVKIIRNKKRFHAQALVEVKILKDLVQWVKNNLKRITKIKGGFGERSGGGEERKKKV